MTTDRSTAPPAPADRRPTSPPETLPTGSPSTSRSSSLTRMLLLVVAVVLVAVAAMSVGGGSTATDRPAEGTPPTGDTGDRGDRDELPALHAERFADRAPGDPRALGDVDAPVVMIEWGDFLCGYCARFARETEPELIRRYVDTGLLRIEWRDLPLQGDGAWVAAVGGRAAADQDAFWAYHERLYADSTSDRQARLTREGMGALAEELGLDAARFEAVFDDDEVVADVAAELQQAQRLGINGTPAFLIDDQPVIGAQPLETFARIIEAAAAARGADLP